MGSGGGHFAVGAVFLGVGASSFQGQEGKQANDQDVLEFRYVRCAGVVARRYQREAAGGCGPGFHRGPLGICVTNGPAVVIAPVAPAVVVAPAAPVAIAPPVVVAAPAPPAVVVAPAAPAVVVAPAVVCGRGLRWHAGFRRCVVLDYTNFMKMGRPAPAHLFFESRPIVHTRDHRRHRD